MEKIQLAMVAGSSLVNSGKVIRTIAQIDVEFSNSMIEALFRSLKHHWLFRMHLNSKDNVQQAVDQYLDEYNNRIHHHALNGATPFEIFFGIWTSESQSDLYTATIVARAVRAEFNLSVSCGFCPT
ncbi:MAG: transposase [Oligoflexia bacterium]|nr:transposase [Oligoflexia bacterium]